MRIIWGVKPAVTEAGRLYFDRAPGRDDNRAGPIVAGQFDDIRFQRGNDREQRRDKVDVWPAPGWRPIRRGARLYRQS